jgi:hypothetical protein
MSIERDSFGFVASCDNCPNTEDVPDAATFQEAVDHIKKEGWLITRTGPNWFHHCGACQANEFGG